MCGLVGVLGQRPVSIEHVAHMRDRLQHRGPDHAGLWADAEERVVLGHRRLSIIDLDSASNQPFVSRDGRYVLVYNGEIYNHVALRKELEADGVRFRTASDTEVLLEAFVHWGQACLTRLSGMFAFAVWDDVARELFCARDRAGEKPFHYARLGADFVFGSELKALCAYPGFVSNVSFEAVVDFLSFGFVPEPATIWEGCHKLPAGHFMRVRFPAAGVATWEAPQPYWRWTPRPDASVRDWGPEIRATLRAAASEMAIADVPLGSFLSGGVDSSSVTAALSRSGHDVRAFNVGFAERAYDERPWARRVATRYQTTFSETVVTADDVDPVMETLLAQYDEPFGDYSYLPTYYLCREARKHITVALSGDGADELFAGYRKYQRLSQIAWAERLPRALLTPVLRPAARLVPRRHRRTFHQYTTDRTTMLTDMLILGLGDEVWRSVARGPLRGALERHRPQDTIRRLLRCGPADLGPVDAMRYLDLAMTLSGDILVKVDRASMAVSLEVRPVYLHRDLLALAERIPAAALATSAVAKKAIKRSFEPWLPRDLLYRRKMGFHMPLGRWMRGRLQNFGSASSSPRLDFIIEPRFRRRLWDEHQRGLGDHTATLHNLAFLDRWLQRWLP